ncbi:unnamed protein product [Rhizopus stolonifer]
MKDTVDSKRELEIGQLETRYKSTYKFIKEDDKQTIVRLAIKPTDPDFPFELNTLQLQLSIPLDYPSTVCQIQVLNTDIPKGFAINLEKGYEAHVTTVSTHSTLVRQMNWLDRNMESLLQQAPAPTVRFISHVEREDTRHLEHSDTTRPLSEKPIKVHAPKKTSTPPSPPSPPSPQQQQQKTSSSLPQQVSSSSKSQQKHASSLSNSFIKSKLVVTKYTTEQKTQANIRRQQELKQLETRFCDSYKMRSNEIVVLTMQINDTEFTFDLKPLQLKYHVPLLYPLEPCTIEIESKKLDDTRKSWVQYGFDQHNRETSLFEKLNWMNRHLQTWLTTPVKMEEKKSTLSISAPSFVPASAPLASSSVFVPPKEEVRKNKVIVVNDPSYLIDDQESNEHSSEHSSDDDSEDYSDDDSDASNQASLPAIPPTNIKRGTEIRLVEPTLDNISLFRCTSLHLIVRCARCKNTTAIENIQPQQEDNKERWMCCPTCSSVMGVKFFAELVHQGSLSLGLVQLAGCSMYEILRSQFMATCAQCMADMPHSLATFDSPRKLACLSCHAKITIGLGEHCRLVKLGDGGERLVADEKQVMMKLKRKKRRQEDGLVVGEPLSDQGICSHYRKSKRWFRFPCCQKLYACDICHDSHEDHSYELARRHVCGLCSREQSIVIGKACVCGHEFEKTVHKGAFWEGGKGVRNKDVMSRKDPHKHKGIGKTSSKKQERVGASGKEHVQERKKIE